MVGAHQNLNGSRDLTTSLLGTFCHPRASTCYDQPIYHAVKLLHHHSMDDDTLRHVYKAVVLSKLLYATPAWWGFTIAADKQCLEAAI